MEREARELHAAELAVWEADEEIRKAEAAAAKSNLAKRAKAGASRDELRELAKQAATSDNDESPSCPRYILNDATTEKVGELLRDNPNGLMIYRDELAGFLRSLDKQGHEGDRAFYLEAWNGTASFACDRIGRGEIFIPSLCLSLFGTIQPGPLSQYLRAASVGAGADGFVPRFQLLVYPDPPRKFVNIDRYPDTEKRNAAFAVFRHLHELNPLAIGAVVDEEGGIPYLRFAPDAQPVFDQWREVLENRLIDGNESPLLIEHLAKYRSLMLSLALLFHLSNDSEGDVSREATERAISWCAFLEAHAHRVYHAASEADTETAGRLAERIRQSLPNPFTLRDVYRKGWAGLTTPEEAEKAVNLLEGRDWIKGVLTKPDGAGRPTVQYWVHPDLLRTAESVHPQGEISEASQKSDFGGDDREEGVL